MTYAETSFDVAPAFTLRVEVPSHVHAIEQRTSTAGFANSGDRTAVERKGGTVPREMNDSCPKPHAASPATSARMRIGFSGTILVLALVLLTSACNTIGQPSGETLERINATIEANADCMVAHGWLQFENLAHDSDGFLRVAGDINIAESQGEDFFAAQEACEYTHG
ncbi:MAG: hypothetical protein IH941_05370 [Acidobacteria bacterium]|nr:hypothetical protein [Acidobacteriota bacterium]